MRFREEVPLFSVIVFARASPRDKPKPQAPWVDGGTTAPASHTPIIDRARFLASTLNLSHKSITFTLLYPMNEGSTTHTMKPSVLLNEGNTTTAQFHSWNSSSFWAVLIGCFFWAEDCGGLGLECKELRF